MKFDFKKHGSKLLLCIKPFLGPGNNNLIMPGRVYMIVSRNPETGRILIAHKKPDDSPLDARASYFRLKQETIESNFVFAGKPEKEEYDRMMLKGSMEIALMTEENYLIANILCAQMGEHEHKVVLARHWSWHKMVFVRSIGEQVAPGILSAKPDEWADPLFGEAIENH